MFQCRAVQTDQVFVYVLDFLENGIFTNSSFNKITAMRINQKIASVLPSCYSPSPIPTNVVAWVLQATTGVSTC